MAKKRKLPSSETEAYVPVEYQPPEEDQEQEEDTNDVVEEENEEPEPQNDTVDPFTEAKEEEKEEEEEEEKYVEEPVEKLLEPFSKEQLALLVKEAVAKHSDLIESVHQLADADPAHRKIFVHGLGWDTDTETLISVFSKYGEIEDCKAVVDKISGKPKGYAFILFKHRVGAKKALQQPQKKIGTRLTSCQLASTGPIPAPPPNVAAPASVSEYTQRKIFVSNVAAELDPAKLTEFFSQFGEIEEGPLGLDKATGKPKGFCLFVYKSIDSAKKALEEPHKVFEGVTLHCYKAVDGPKPGQKGGFHQPNQQFHPHSSKRFKGGKYPPRGGGGGAPHQQQHMMAPAGMNPAAAALAPALGQALTTLLAGQGGGLGNLLGGFGAQANQGMPPQQGYGAQQGGYGMQAAYPGQQLGQGGGRPQMGGGAPYMGHGH